MKHFSAKLTAATLTSFVGTLVGSVVATPVFAQITNPAVQGDLGNDAEAAASGATFTSYFVSLWQAVIGIGGLMVLLYFIWGAIEWITAAGDSGKVDKARNRMTQAVIGLVILVSSFTIIGFISATVFGNQFNILNPVIPRPDMVNSGNQSTQTERQGSTIVVPAGTGTRAPSTGTRK